MSPYWESACCELDKMTVATCEYLGEVTRYSQVYHVITVKRKRSKKNVGVLRSTDFRNNLPALREGRFEIKIKRRGNRFINAWKRKISRKKVNRSTNVIISEIA